MREQRVRSVAIAALALALSAVIGCASGSLEGAQRVRSNTTIDRLYVIVQLGALEIRDVKGMVAALETACAGHVAAQKATISSGMELDPDETSRDVEAFQADGVLVLRPVGAVLGAYGGTAKIIYAVALREARSGRIIWRARAVNEGGTAMTEKRDRLTAEAIVADLVKEGVFRGAYAK